MQRPETARTSLTTHSSDASLAAFFDAAIDAGLAVALWRRPGQPAYEGVVDLSGLARPASVDFQTGQPAFVISPFIGDAAHPPLCIRADVRLTPQGVQTQQRLWNGERQRYEVFLAAFRTRLAAPDLPTIRWHLPGQLHAPYGADFAEYCRLVNSAIDFILASDIKKVVVSRSISAPLSTDFQPVPAFQTLCRRYPGAFVSLVAIPGVGTWIGASPELLLSSDERALTTMALAGTQLYAPSQPLADVRWSAKEIEEQALVSDYVRDFFNRAGAGIVGETGPRTVVAGNVVHLQTDFRVELPHHELMALANRVLHELHPTSAVCGMPKDKALAFILQHEGYDRSFYSGFLGPVNIDGQSHLYVNLRCMQLDEQAAYLYAGGGVTADSNPEAEWRETELKAGTLLAVLRDDVAPPVAWARAAGSPA